MKNQRTFQYMALNNKANVFLIVLIFAVKSLCAQLVHPGISHKLSDLDRMRKMVEAERDPWITTYNNMKSAGYSSYDYTVAGSSSNTTITNLRIFENDGNAAYHNALMWYITGDERHAQKSIEIFSAWSNITRIENQFALSNGGALWRMVEGAEIIKHTYNGWSQTDQQAFADMLVYPGWSGTQEPTAAMASKDVSFYWNIYQGDRARHGNQGLFGFRSLMAMGIFLDNEIIYDRALRYLQGLPHREDDLPYPSGPSITELATTGNEYYEEYKITSWSSEIEDYGYNEVMSNYIWKNGQSQESSRDQAHALGGVSIITAMSEIAWNQGDDLYGHLDNRPLLGMEFYLRYNLSYEHSYPDQLTPWEPTVESEEFIERIDRSGRWKSLKMNPWTAADLTNWNRGLHNLNPIYEMNLGHYKGRISVDPSKYKWLQRGFDALTEAIGVEDGANLGSHPGWGGLKFRRVSPGDPISGFDVNGLPVFKMNDLSVVIEAENYDYFVLDGEDRTYHDTSSTNDGGEYRIDEGVDVKICSEGGYAVTDIEDSEWLTYTIAVPSTGTYDINIRYASQNADGNIKFSFDGVDTTEFISVPHGADNSEGLTDWKDFEVASEIRLEKGVQQMKVLFSGSTNAFDLNNISLLLIEEEPDPINLAIAHGTASQSVDSDPCPYGGCAELAIDGDTNGSFGGGSVSHSSHGSSGSLKWWQVDLGANYRVETIDIYNRTGGYQSRLSDITIEVIDSEDNVVFTQFYEGYPDSTASISTEGVVGQVVKISKTTDTGITLAEVEVYGVDSVVTLSNEDVAFKNSVQLYPNPTTGVFTIVNAVGSDVVVYNTLGQVVLKEAIAIAQKRIDLSSFSKGVYFVKIHRDRAMFAEKIILN